MPSTLSQGQKERVEKRRFPRVPARFPIFFSMDTNDQATQQGIVLNISPQGMLISCEREFVPGQRLGLSPKPEGNGHKHVIGEVRWSKETLDGNLAGLFFEDTANLFSFLLDLLPSQGIDRRFLQEVINNIDDTIVLLDKDLKIVAISKKQPIISVSQDQVLNKRVTEVPSLLKLLIKEGQLSKSTLKDVFDSKKERYLPGLKISYGTNGDRKQFFFNLAIRPISSKGVTSHLLVQIRDVSSLYQLKEKLKERDKLHWEQYRLTLMGHIVDELLEDIINPLSAAIGRLDLLSMKMSHYKNENQFGSLVDGWIKELGIIDSLMEQITQYCTIAAKRREREKLGALDGKISFKRLVQETVSILKINSHFKDVDIRLDLEDSDLSISGEYFDWLNALIALLQVISREMQFQDRKEILIETRLLDNTILLAITHNARALRLPLEKEMGLGILELIQRKYNATIDITGGSGSQKITFLIEIEE